MFQVFVTPITFATLKMEQLSELEYDASKIPMCKLDSMRLVQHFGKSIDSYFRYAKYIAYTNVILFLINFGSLFIFTDLGKDVLYNEPKPLNSADLEYILKIGLITIAMIATTIGWKWCVNRSNHEDPHLGDDRMDINNDTISKCINLKSLFPRWIPMIRVFVILVFLGLLIGYYYFQLALKNWTGEPTLVSLVFVIIDIGWRLSTNLLTSLESHEKSTSYRKSDCIKSIILRMITFSIFMIVQNQSLMQLVNLLILNTILAPVTNLIYAYLYKKCCFLICCVEKRSVGDVNYKLTFDIADEYTQILFNQHLIARCILNVPLSPLIGSVNCFLAIWCGKYKILKLCKKPERDGNRFIRILTVFGIVNSITIIANAIL